MSRPTISVIIVVKNDRGITQTLERLTNDPVKEPFEIIVVDSSEPSRLADIKAQYPHVRWDQFPVSAKRTTPAQRNRGLELAKGDIIAFIDANCIPEPGWLNAIIESIEGGEDIVCGPVRDSNPKNLVHYATEHPKAKYLEECTTINVGLRREVAEKVGKFDTKLPFGQDVDYFWRARDAGYRIFFNPKVIISHDWGDNHEQLKRAFKYGQARARLYRKHWRTRYTQLPREAHTWIYPLFILGLPLTFVMPFYPLLVFIPVIKNLSHNPIGLVVHHLTFGAGVISGTFT